MEQERKYLAQIKSALRSEIERLLKKTEEYSGDSYDLAKFFWEHQSEMDGPEKRFMWDEAERVAGVGEETNRQLYRMFKLLDSPYFSGIDFREEDEEEPMQIHIGKFSFFDRTNTYIIFDWRSPIAGMYYEFEEGPAYYETPAYHDVPAGKICGTILGKRQYIISKGTLELVLKNGSSIRDEVLMKTLAQTSDAKMKDIAATIQKEQNALIRNETADTLIVQGVAGSGKTSVALHRIAYFLYRYRGEISAENFLILSPNGVFVDYISNVLPELGEDKVRSIEMDDLARRYLPDGMKREKLSRQPERFASGGDERWLARSRFKASAEFVRLLEQYCGHCDRTIFTPGTYFYEGGKVDGEFVRKCYERKRSMPVFRRLKETADEMAQEIRSAGKRSVPGTRKPEIFEKLKSELMYGSTLELYEGFYGYINRPELFVYRESGVLESADVFPFLYLRLYLEGGPGTDELKQRIKYLIVDEMQDYTPVQHAVLDKLYPCRKTILGDFFQKVYPFAEETGRFLESLYPGALRLQMNKSYRCTYEIMEFALKIQPCESMELVERHGEAVAVAESRTLSEEREELLKRAEEFLTRRDGAKLGILCKSHEQAEDMAKWLEERISDKKRLHLFTYDSREFFDGAIVTSVALAKGLEFDSVIIPDADSENYATEYDRGLLYVACTRAMHSLTVLYCGEKSRFLP